MMFTHGSLFSGIGGFDLAAEWMGWENVFHCEWNDFGKQVLQYYWPKAKSYGDITKTDFTIWRGKIDVLTGGFPCQPYSVAGKRKGTEDDRHLWPEMLRAIREIQPSWVVGENVSGLINWNGGLVFDEVQTDLENEGYEVWANVLPAAGVNAPHRRDRVWFVAYNQHNCNRRREQHQESEQKTNRASENTWSNGCSNGEYDKQISKRNEWKFSTGSKERIFVCEALQNDTNSKSKQSERLQPEQRNLSKQEQGQSGRINSEMGNANVTDTNGRRQSRKEHGEEESGRIAKKSVSNHWQNFPTQSPICDGDDGLSSRLDGITFPKWRNESIKAGGNAIVPQVAFQIFKAINELKSK